jgi:MFS family permease
VVVGAAALIFSTGSNSYAQLAATPDLRGRVIAIRMALGIGGTVVGAPVVGWVVDAFGPRWGAGVAAISGLAAASIAALLLVAGRSSREWPLDAKPPRT